MVDIENIDEYDGVKPAVDRLKRFQRKLLKARPVRRCPKCLSISLEFDAENNRLLCQDCGYEEKVKK